MGFTVREKSGLDWLTDKDDKTCNNREDNRNIYAELDTPIPLTWVRVVVNNGGNDALIGRLDLFSPLYCNIKPINKSGSNDLIDLLNLFSPSYNDIFPINNNDGNDLIDLLSFFLTIILQKLSWPWLKDDGWSWECSTLTLCYL